jgi:hypothetical protein
LTRSPRTAATARNQVNNIWLMKQVFLSLLFREFWILIFFFFRKCKPTWKPKLTDEAKVRRLNWALEHQHWTLEVWKNIIWTDETSVILGHRRGAQRIWRTACEVYNPNCIRRRFKKASELMFWGSFSYDL